MKKMLKGFVIVGLMFSLCSLNAYAYTESNEKQVENSGDITEVLNVEGVRIEPRYVPCPVFGGKHQMQGRGVGRLLLNNTELFTGYANQCLYCDDVIVSEYSPYYHTMLGRYGYWNPGYQLGTHVTMNVGVVYYNGNLRDDPFFDSFYWT